MLAASQARLTTGTPLTERLTRAFFRAFFSLLLAAIALAQWAVVARVLARLGVSVPVALHVAIPVGVYVFNRWLAGHLRAGGRRPPGLRLYTGFAFTSVFCGVFLLVSAVVWGALNAGIVTAEAALGGLGVAGNLTALERPFALLVDVGLSAIVGLFLAGYTVGRRALTVSRHRIPVPGLPPALAGFRIAHLSDLHIGAYLDRDELAAHVARVNALAPDLVCITGDLVDRADTCAGGFPVLAGLRARHGVLVTLGNHDVAAGAEVVTAALRRHTPFTVLRNAAAEIVVDGARLAVLGVDDLGRDWARGVVEHPALPPLARAVPADATVVVLSHRPDCFPQAAALGAHLMLSGHTHGGQLGLPAFLGRRVRNLAEFITRFDRGLFQEGGATLVVSHGLGFTGQPIRLFTPREIGCLELWPA